MTLQIKKSNQHGAAMILFAMVMMIVLSLIAVGFAFLVRNDQRQTLDKSLSNQAIYAAETAINRKAKALKDGTETTTLRDDCSGTVGEVFTGFPEVQITCLNWDAEPEVLSIDNIDESPKSVVIKPSAGDVQYFAVRWKPKTSCDSATTWGQFLDTLDGANPCPYLKVTLSEADQVYSGRGTVIYSRAQSDASAVPTNSAFNTFSYAQENGGTYSPDTAADDFGGQIAGSPSGEIDNSFCNGGYCLIRIKVPNGGTWTNSDIGLVSFSAIGGQVDIEVSAYTSALNLATETTNFFPNATTPPVLWDAPSRVKLVGAQAVIDATAKANDVIKRVRVSVPIGSDTWVPGFAINANTICKNYQVNANGNTAAVPAMPHPVCY